MANHKVDTSQAQVLHDYNERLQESHGERNQKKKKNISLPIYPNKPWLVKKKKKKKNQMDGMGKK